MEPKLPAFFRLAPEVARALQMHLPVVALESTVVTHGLPYPENRQLAEDMETEVRQLSAVPATISVLDGFLRIGTPPDAMERLARAEGMVKITTRDFAPAVAQKWSGGTTVAATMAAAYTAGIRVFATGGIGGVHRRVDPNSPAEDISADLQQLANTPMIVVCAGAKAILDLPATLEYLETHSVPVVGYRTGEFPAFYSHSSGLPVSATVDTPQEAAHILKTQWQLGLKGAVLVVVPPPEPLPNEQVQEAIEAALQEAAVHGITGKAVTPFLLSQVSKHTGGASLRANLALLRNNARVASEIARALVEGQNRQLA